MKPKTFVATQKSIIRRWHLIDFDGQISSFKRSKIRMLASTAIPIERINPAIPAKVKVTGNKPEQKMYRWHTGYPGGFRQRPFKKQMDLHPDRIVTAAVSRMLPKNKLRPLRLKRLKVFPGPTHPYQEKLK